MPTERLASTRKDSDLDDQQQGLLLLPGNTLCRVRSLDSSNQLQNLDYVLGAKHGPSHNHLEKC